MASLISLRLLGPVGCAKDVISAVGIPRHQVTGARCNRHITAIPADAGLETVTISLDPGAVHRYSGDVIQDRGGATIAPATATATAGGKPGGKSDK